MRCYFNVRPKADMTQLSLIYRTETTTEKCKTEKLKSKKTDMLRSNSKKSEESFYRTALVNCYGLKLLHKMLTAGKKYKRVVIFGTLSFPIGR